MIWLLFFLVGILVGVFATCGTLWAVFDKDYM